MQGYAQFQGVLGHEFVGVVDRVGTGPENTSGQGGSTSPLDREATTPLQAGDWLGKRVVGEINAACGTCPTCVAGRPTHCPHRTALGIRDRDGALAEYFCLPARNLHAVPAQVPDEVAVFAEPLAAACEVLDQVHIRPTDRVIVLGDGKLGLLVAQVLALSGCDLVVVGRHTKKLAILTARGIPGQLEFAGLEGSADRVIECTGRPEGFRTARRLVRSGGTIVLKSTYHGLVQADLSDLVVNEVRLVGSRCGPFAAALRLLARKWVDVESLIEAVYPLGQALSALEHASRHGALKVLVRP
jgi:threonine dehydrogenase-like Zn-dependent dehydrogenase